MEEAFIGVRNDQIYNIYIYIYIYVCVCVCVCDSDKCNPLPVDWKYALFLRKYIEIHFPISSFSAVLKW